MYNEGLESLTGKELLKLSMIKIFVLPGSRQRIDTNQKKEEVELVPNIESYATPEVTKLVQTVGKIANPHDQYKTSVAYLENNAILTDLKTRRQHAKPFSDISTEQLVSHEERIKIRKYDDSPKFEAGETSKITSSVN